MFGATNGDSEPLKDVEESLDWVWMVKESFFRLRVSKGLTGGLTESASDWSESAEDGVSESCTTVVAGRS